MAQQPSRKLLKRVGEQREPYGAPQHDQTTVEQRNDVLERTFGKKAAHIYHSPIERLLGLHEAIFIAQLRWFLDRPKGGQIINDERGRWNSSYHSFEDWQRYLPRMSESSFRRMTSRLEKLGIVWAKRGVRQKYYGINYDLLAYFLINPDVLDIKERKLKGTF